MTKISTKKIKKEKQYINNLQTSVLFRNTGEDRFSTSTLTPSHGLENWLFIMKFLQLRDSYVTNMCDGFKSQIILKKIKTFKIYQHVQFSQTISLLSNFTHS